MKLGFLLVLLMNIGCSYGQEVKVAMVEDQDLIHLLNNIKELSSTRTKNLSITIFSVANPSGSAGNGSDEIDYDLLIAVSEYDELPEQSLFRLSNFYNPAIKKWNTKTGDPEVTIEYGPYDDRKEILLRISLQNILLE
jgi:hypothetical protein